MVAMNVPDRVSGSASFSARLETALLNPVRAFRPKYLPLLMVYVAYGSLGLISIAESFWIKKSLVLTPEELASLSIWLSMPWTVKMVFGELVDAVPIFGSQRRSYVFIGAILMAADFLLLAGTAGDWFAFAELDDLYRIAAFLGIIGVVIQDVAADAMSAEVVERTHKDGRSRDKAEVDRELGMVQVLGRIAMSIAAFVAAGLAGWVATRYSYSTVFLIALVIPIISVSGALLVDLEPVERRPIDWRILGGGLAYGGVVLALAGAKLPYCQEIVFVISLIVVCTMLWHVIGDVGPETRRTIVCAAAIIFAYRAVPSIGQGFTWFTIDVLGFDESFQGTLRQMGAGLALLGTWLFSDAITRRPVASVLLGLTLITTVLALPGLALTMGLSDWTERVFGFGANTIALLDTAAMSPFMQLSMIPLLTLCAIYAPAGRRATWFALAASLMSLALIAGALQTKYLNAIYAVTRGSYENLPYIVAWATAIGLIVPIGAIARRPGPASRG